MTVRIFCKFWSQLLRIPFICCMWDFCTTRIEYACFAAVCGIVLGEAGAFCYTFFHYLQKKRR